MGKAWQNESMEKNKIKEYGTDKESVIPKMGAADAAFARKLMAHPPSGLAWACAALKGADEASQVVAVWCCLRPSAFEEGGESGDARRARLAGLAHHRWGGLFAQEMPRLWLAEPDGARSWMETLTDLKDSGVEEGIRSALARRAVAEPMIQAALDAQGVDEIEALFDRSVSLRGEAPQEWQSELASRLVPAACHARLAITFVRLSKGPLPKMERLARSACAAMAARVLEDPEQAYELLHGMVMRGLLGQYDDRSDALAGVFDALVAAPRPALAPAPEGGSKKMFAGFKVPLSMAMELMCRGQFEAGLAAARWAVLLGAGGNESASELTDGLTRRNVCMEVGVFEGKGWSRGVVSARALSEPAMILGRADVCAELRSMGWGWPGKARALELSKQVSELGDIAVKTGARCLLPGAGAPSDAAAGMMAFWESQQINRMLRAGATAPDPAPARGGMRI